MAHEFPRNTVVMKKRLADQLGVDNDGGETFKGRKLIERDSPINGGISAGAGEREAIVVDDTKEHGEPLLKIYDELLPKLEKISVSEKDPAEMERRILAEVFKTTREKMPVDSKIARFAASIKPDKKVPLAEFLHGGVCRHQALLAGYLIEKLIKKGILKGMVSIDRSTDMYRGEVSAHVWTRYTSVDGVVYVVDATHNFIGPLDTDYKDKRVWNYHRENDDEREAVAVFSEDPFASQNLGKRILRLVGLGKVIPRIEQRQSVPKKPKAPARQPFNDPNPVMMFPSLKKPDKPYEKESEPFPIMNLKDLWRAEDPEGTNPMNPYTKGNRWKDE